MPRFSTGPDEVTAPAPDAQLFRSSPAWMFLIIFAAALPAATAVILLLALLDGDSASWRRIGGAAGDSLPYCLLIAAGAAWQVRRRRTWVRISSGGIELAADGGDPILLDWSETRSARVHRRGLWAVLDVVPTDPDSVRSTDPRRDLPRMRDTADGKAFSVPVGGLRPGPAALRSALARHPPKYDQPEEPR